MVDKTLQLYYAMSEMLWEHRSARVAYPRKFVLNLEQHRDYLRDVEFLNQSLAKPIDPTWHMGVDIEIDASSPGLMVASDGSEVPLP